MADLDFFRRQGPFTLGNIMSHLEQKGVDVSISDSLSRKSNIEDVAAIGEATKSDITFLDNIKYRHYLTETKAKACFVKSGQFLRGPDNVICVFVEDPYYAYALTAHMFYPKIVAFPKQEKPIHPSAKIASTAIIHPNVYIGPNVEIGEGTEVHGGAHIGFGVKIGKNCKISPNTTIQFSIIGDDVFIHPGCRIGQDGFGFATHHGKHTKVPQLGRVIIENDVEIGANTCIDRGTAPDTVIGTESRLDNLIQIGHNVKIGKGCVIVAGVGIGGSTKIGDNVAIGGQAGVAGHLKIGKQVKIAAQSGVMRDIEDNQAVGGSPAVPIRQFHKQQVILEGLTKDK